MHCMGRAMALDDLLDRLEREAGTAGTPAARHGVPPDPLETLGSTAGTAGTSPNDAVLDASVATWTHEILEGDPAPHVIHDATPTADSAAVAMEPIGIVAPAKSCRSCRHHRRPGLSDPGYCAHRTDTPHAYGPNHPLHLLPDDGGAGCACWQRKN